MGPDTSGSSRIAYPSLESLRGVITEVLSDALDSCSRVALVDFPNHTNVGDSAIWIGETRFLRDHEIDIAYSCTMGTYDPETLRRRLGSNGIILLHGGGNFGDIWPDHQQFRLDLIQRFPDFRILQLPQTIHFQDSRSAELTRDLLARHDNLVLLVRDRTSLEFARGALMAEARLCPDLAIWLRPEQPNAPTLDTLFLMRRDREAPRRSAVPTGSKEVDWIGMAPASIGQRIVMSSLFRTNRILTSRLEVRSNPFFERVANPVRQRLAVQRFALGIDLLAEARVVITDRLHGHLLSLLIDRSSIILDNNYGKLSGFHATWTHDLPNVHIASSVSEAMEIAPRINSISG